MYWIRKCAVEIGPKTGVLGRGWSGLRIGFDCVHSSGRDPNTGKVVLYGLTPESRGWIKDHGKRLRVVAGYETTGTGDIFNGDITKVEIGEKHVVTIEAGDGDLAIGERRISLSMAPGVRLADIFEQLKAELGITIRQSSTMPDLVYFHGISLYGPVALYLDWLCQEASCEWWIQDGQLVVVPIGEALDEQAQVVSQDTGLIGVPKRVQKRERRTQGEVDEGDDADAGTTTGASRRVEWKQLLDHRMRPGRLVQLTSESITGVYIATKVKFIGDTHESDWYCEVEAKERRT